MKTTDPGNNGQSWSERAQEMRGAKVLFFSFFAGMALFWFKGTVIEVNKGQSIKSRIHTYLSTPGYIDSIFIDFENDSESRANYRTDFFIKYSANGINFRTRCGVRANEDGSFTYTIPEAWSAAHKLAPNQAVHINRYEIDKKDCEFLVAKSLRSGITTPVEVKYDPEHPQWNDWTLKDHRPTHPIFILFLGAIMALLLGAVVAITKHRSLTSKILNWSFVLFIGLVTGPFFSGWEQVYAKLFPNHPLEPAQIIPFDERLDPKVCDALR